MRKKNLLLIGYASLMMLCSGNLFAQHGVLLPENIDGYLPCVCGGDHDSGEAHQVVSQVISQQQLLPNNSNQVDIRTQVLVNESITPRRFPHPNPGHLTDSIHGSGDVRYVFGAGESSVITSQVVNWPASGGALNSNSILVGSEYSQNMVVGIYDNMGLAAGELKGIRLYGNTATDVSHTITDYEGAASGGSAPSGRWYYDLGITISDADTNSIHVYDPEQYTIGLPLSAGLVTAVNGNDIGDGSPRSSNPGSAILKSVSHVSTGQTTGHGAVKYVSGNSGWGWSTGTPGAGTMQVGAILRPYFNTSIQKYVVPVWNHVSMSSAANWNNAVRTQTAFNFDIARAALLYTSTRDVNTRTDDGKLILREIPGSPASLSDFNTDATSAEYVRPTTVLLSGTNDLNDITIGDVEWYIGYFASTVTSIDTMIFEAYNPSGCGHLSGWASYIRNNVTFDTTAYGTVSSGRYVDAAIRLLDGADVCVTGDVTDNTSTLYSLGTAGSGATDAVLVLPGANDTNGNRSNFRLKIGGDANMLHTQDSGYTIASNPLNYGYLYSDAAGSGPGAPFPLAQKEVYLSGGTNSYTEVAGLDYSYAHPREAGTITATGMPYTTTTASVYGVRGAYNGNANIHTQSIGDGTTPNDTTSIIEIGSGTTNQNFFNIYSSGMLKNFRGCNYLVCDSLVIGVGGVAPAFNITGPNPLYIINDGDGTSAYCCEGGIRFNTEGVASINDAITNAAAGGDLHIQAHSFVRFYGNDVTFAQAADNEVKILSDKNAIYVEQNLSFTDADTAHFTVWARGDADTKRGNTDLYCSTGVTGAVRIDGNVEATYAGGSNGTGLILFRSDNDDVLVGGTFDFTNDIATDGSGELMVQAGQDVRIDDDVTLTQDGQRSMLFEAKKTAAFGGEFKVAMGATMTNGDLTIKAGYPNFLSTADVVSPLNWGVGTCVTDGYANREANQAPGTGGDIWFGGNVDIALTPTLADSVDTYIRAYNSIYIDGDFKHELTSAYTSGGGIVDTTLLYAETGNIEAINVAGTDIEFAIGAADSVYYLLQAGNKLGDPCGVTLCVTPATYNEWNGNILFGDDKTYTMNHDGVGPTLISASRDIENQVGADFTFTYKNTGLGSEDNLTITAGRHIETHAPYVIDYSTAGTGIESSITLQAGHQTANCDFLLCKTTEGASNLAYNISPYTSTGFANEFASGGAGQGSILAFSTMDFKYYGDSAILLTALNGNIETDPYLHGSYDGGAKMTFDHQGKGVVRMEAIDIKLHDVLEYTGTTHTSDSNGFFYMAAFDSILTRNIAYSNLEDKGSVYITTDKYKDGVTCGEYNSATGGPGIHQGHIVLGYVADCDNSGTSKDHVLFDFNSSALNAHTEGANLYIKAGYEGFAKNPVTGKANTTLFAGRPNDAGKGYGGNITFDFMEIYMAKGSGTAGGYTEISTPNGNIWGKDSLQYHGIDGHLLVDAGLGSLEDVLHAVRWPGFSDYTKGAGSEAMLNTQVPYACGNTGEWRTGNIMLKGGSIDFTDVTGSGVPGMGNATFRTREGFIDIYDKFNATNMSGHLLTYAGLGGASGTKTNEWGDVSVRDFQYTQVENSGSVFFGADDNIMLNYGYSNGKEYAYNYGNYADQYDIETANLAAANNPYYGTAYESLSTECYAKFDVNKNGYMWYRDGTTDAGSGWTRRYHRLFRGCEAPIAAQTGVCSPLTGECETIDNGARPLTFDFNVLADGSTKVRSGGLAVVATNYIDLFTAFTYYGGEGSGLHAVPGMSNLKGENVSGYGLYMKSTYDGSAPEKRRLTCEGCGSSDEWTYIGFHDDARIFPNHQKALVEAPVVEFFGHAELNTTHLRGTNTKLTIKADSLIFHDSAIFDGPAIELIPYTTDAEKRAADLSNGNYRYGVISDNDGKRYQEYGKAISMTDRMLPVIELGYQRCYEPDKVGNASPNVNVRSAALGTRAKEATPMVGGDVIVAFKNGFSLPIMNTVVANHARISFISDSIDGEGNVYDDAFIRTDLLRIRNKVEFYTDPAQDKDRRGILKMTSKDQMPSVQEAGIYPNHIHTEPGSELSIPGEDSLVVIATTTIGGYGKIHENIVVKENGILAPGFASLMECDCQSGENQGTLHVHNLKMEDHSILRISMSQQLVYNPDTKTNEWTMVADTIEVNDDLYFAEKVQLQVLSDFDYFYPGCYLFFVYDETQISPEYVKNLTLQKSRFGDNYLVLDFSEPGRVYLCVTEFPTPVVTRYIHLHTIDGVTTNPAGNMDHFVAGHKDFTFTATYADGTPLEVLAKGYYTRTSVKLSGTHVSGNVYEYKIQQVVQPWDITFGDPDTSIGVGNDGIHTQRVWSHKNTLYVNVEKEDVVSIFNMTGVLYQKIEIPAGLKTLTLERGVYVVTLKDGSVHKVVIK